MAYKTEELYKKALEAIEANKLIFLEDIYAHLGISHDTYYNHFPLKSEESEAIKELLAKNKIDLKVSMRSKWYKSDNPTLQMGLYKLISTDEERKNLSMVYNDHTTKGDKINIPLIHWVDSEDQD